MDFGLPQNRKRLFIVGIRKTTASSDFDWAELKSHTPWPLASFDSVLNKNLPADDQTTFPDGVRESISWGLEQIKAKNGCPNKEHWIIDCDASERWRSCRKEVSPCLTHSRPSASGSRAKSEDSPRMRPSAFKESSGRGCPGIVIEISDAWWVTP